MTAPPFIRAAEVWIIPDATGGRLRYDNSVCADATMGEMQARPAIAIPVLDAAGRLKAVTVWRF